MESHTQRATFFTYTTILRSEKELFFFFFNDTATTEIYTLSLHDALPIYDRQRVERDPDRHVLEVVLARAHEDEVASARSEEHTSELQSQSNLVCRLLLEKKKPAGETVTTHV